MHCSSVGSDRLEIPSPFFRFILFINVRSEEKDAGFHICPKTRKILCTENYRNFSLKSLENWRLRKLERKKKRNSETDIAIFETIQHYNSPLCWILENLFTRNPRDNGLFRQKLIASTIAVD